jgi:hypothetical protein
MSASAKGRRVARHPCQKTRPNLFFDNDCRDDKDRRDDVADPGGM